MNNNYYQNPIIDDKTYNNPLTYIDIFNLNRGKMATFYIDNESKECSELHGIIEKASYDYIIISDPKTGKWTLLLPNYLNYVIFDENINY